MTWSDRQTDRWTYNKSIKFNKATLLKKRCLALKLIFQVAQLLYDWNVMDNNSIITGGKRHWPKNYTGTQVAVISFVNSKLWVLPIAHWFVGFKLVHSG